MSTRTAALVLVGLAALTAPANAGQAHPLPLVVRATDAVLVKEDRFTYVDVLLTNDSPVAVTAWGVLYSATRGDGTIARRGYGVDTYKSYAEGCHSADLSKCFVPPAQSRRMRFIASSTETFVSIALELEFAIFADGSGIGDERQRADIFKQRVAQFRGWKQVLAILLAAQKDVGHGIEGARAAAVELDKVQPEPGGDPWRNFEATPRTQVSSNLRRGIERPASAAVVLDDMIRMAKSEVEMLTGHLTAR